MKIDGYKIERLIGKGGMAMVYLAIQESLLRPVALKVMNPLYSDSEEFYQRMLGEGRLLAAVRHPNIITIHDIGISNGNHFISMEYVEGGDLRDKLSGGINPEQATDYIETIADCLRVAHDAYIVHRDIKPANILFREDGTLLLADFGIAKQLNAHKDLTLKGSLVGSPSYLSPEQAKGKPVDGRSDIYSLGVLYYEMLTGERPYKGSSDVDIAIKHIGDALPRLPDALSAYAGIIECMMQKEPKKRFPSCTSLLQALHELKRTGRWSGSIANIPLPDVREKPLSNEYKTVVGVTVVDRLDIKQHAKKDRVARFKAIGSTAMDSLKAVIQSVRAKLAQHYRVTMNRLVTAGSSATVNHDATTISTNPDLFTLFTEKWKQLKKWRIGAGIAAVTVVMVVSGLFLTRQAEPEGGNEAGELAPMSIPWLLQRAEDALARDRLTTPASVSAYHYYQQVLSQDPENPSAQSGLEKIAYRYYLLAKKAEGKWDYAKAKRFVASGLMIKPRDQRLLQYQKELQSNNEKAVRTSKQGVSGVIKWFAKLLQ